MSENVDKKLQDKLQNQFSVDEYLNRNIMNQNQRYQENVYLYNNTPTIGLQQDLIDQKEKQQIGNRKVTEVYAKFRGQDDQDDCQKQNYAQTDKNQNQTNIFEHLFKIRTRPYLKNNNVLKHLIKQVVSYYGTKAKPYFEYFEQHRTLKKQLDKFIVAQKKNYRAEKNYNNNLEAMKKIFGSNPSSCDPKLRSSLLRRYTRTLIRQEIIPDLFKNKQIKKSLKSYMLTLKIQALRSINPQLMSRTESH